MAGVTTIPPSACVGTGGPFISIDAFRDTTALHSWSNTCLADVSQASGADRLLASARAISANAVAAAFVPGVPAAVGTTLWTEDVHYLFITRYGHGLTPMGSRCVPGTSTWTLSNSGSPGEPPWSVGRRTCEQQADGRYAFAWVHRTFERSEVAGVIDALGRAKRVENAACDSSADVVKLNVALYPHTSAQQFASAASMCASSDTPLNPVEGLDGVLSAFDALRLE